MWLATLYALGHAAMVLVLGGVAIVFAEQVPGAADAVMGRVVGVTLIGLGLLVAWSAIRGRGVAPVRSRWMLLGDVVRRMIARRSRPTVVVIEHSHPHAHDGAMHDHPHGPVDVAETPDVGTSSVAVLHGHAHRHVAVAPRDPFVTYGSWSSFGVGMLHGVGAETPTQLLVFAAAAHASGRPTSIALLVCFVLGLITANTVVAAIGTAGSRRLLTRPGVALALSTTTAAFSLVIGTILVLGRSSILPPMLGG